MNISLNNFVNLRGIEREALRIKKNGDISNNRYPKAFGSKLTNKSITVDFSDSLIELVTKPKPTIESCIKNLIEISSFCVQKIPKNEILLNSSMPLTTKEEIIKIAKFGTSNIGKIKELYRNGLALRYGKKMQIIGGIHYNFSFDQKLIEYIGKIRKMSSDQLYFSMIRNYFDFIILLPYLFGASPICAKTSIIGKKPSYLNELDNNYYICEYGTSLRMSSCGYQSKAQKNLSISYKNLASYVKDLIKATKSCNKEFSKIGKYNNKGKIQQLNINILQTENEYYETIRPKQLTNLENRIGLELMNNGVKYVEVRTLDTNPFSSIGIDYNTSYFIEALLTTCLLLPPKRYCKKAILRNKINFNKVVTDGRNPKLTLISSNNKQKRFRDIAYKLIDKIERYTKTMGLKYTESIDIQIQKIDCSKKTPSEQIILKSSEKSCYKSWIINQSEKNHKELINNKISKNTILKLEKQAMQSNKTQIKLEKNTINSNVNIEDYINKYNKMYDNFI